MKDLAKGFSIKINHSLVLVRDKNHETPVPFLELSYRTTIRLFSQKNFSAL
jgi:hypothetical protein